MPRILLITPNVEDYASDGLLHGLRELLGADVVDFPKADALYDSVHPEVLGRVRGGGFTLYGLLPDLEIHRDHLLERAMEGEFDLVVFGDVWRTWGLFAEWSVQVVEMLSRDDAFYRLFYLPWSRVSVRALVQPGTAAEKNCANAEGWMFEASPCCPVVVVFVTLIPAARAWAAHTSAFEAFGTTVSSGLAQIAKAAPGSLANVTGLRPGCAAAVPPNAAAIEAV